MALADGVPSSSALTHDAANSTPAQHAPQGLVAQPLSADIIDIETISLDDVEIIPANVISGGEIIDLTEDVIVVPPATTADAHAHPPITSGVITYALLKNNTVAAGTTPVTQVTCGTQKKVCYTFQRDSTAATKITDATQPSRLAMPWQVTEPSVSAALPETILSAPTPPKKTKQDDAVFLTPLPIITYTKTPTRTAKSKPSNPNQNTLIKALLAQKSTPGLYVQQPSALRLSAVRATAPQPTTPRPRAPRPPVPRPTSFIIRAATQSPSGKTQIVNLPVSVSTPVSIVRNVAPGVPGRPTITRNLLIRAPSGTQRPVSRSAFVRTSTGIDFNARNVALATAVSTHATTPDTPITTAPQVTYSVSPIIANVGAGTIVTTTVSSATAKSFIITSTPNPKIRTTCFPTYTKTYIPAPQFRSPQKDANAVKTVPTTDVTMTRPHNLVRSRVLPPCTRTSSSITMLGPRSNATSIAHSFVHASPNFTPSYRRRQLEPGEIPQVRKIPPRTSLGPRSIPASQHHVVTPVQNQAHMAQLKVARHAEHHAESQAQLRALQAHGSSRAVLEATSLAALQAASHAQLEAALQARLKFQQARRQAALQRQHSATLQAQINSHDQIKTAAKSQPQGTINVQLLTASQAQLLAKSKMQLLATTQTPIHATLRAQLQATSQAQPQVTQAHLQATSKLQATPQIQIRPTSLGHIQGTSQTQLQTVSQAQLQALTQLQAIPRKQFRATSIGQLQGTSQIQLQAVPRPQLQATSLQAVPQMQLSANSLPQLQSNSYAQHQGASQVQLQSTSQTQLQVNSEAQLQAASQAQLQAISQSQLQRISQVSSQAQFQAFSQAQHQATSQVQFQATSQIQNQTTPQAQLQSVSQTQFHTLPLKIEQITSQTELQIGSQAQLITVSQSQLQGVSQTRFQNVVQAQLPVTSQALPDSGTQPQHQTGSITQLPLSSGTYVQPSARTHHRLIIRSANPKTSETEKIIPAPAIAEPAAIGANILNEQLPNTSLPSSLDVGSTSIHTTSTRTLSTGTTLIMPHYKTTVFKNLSTIASSEPSRLTTPTTTAPSAEKVVVRRPVAYFSARRTFPTQSGTPVNVHRHIIRTIPRHILDGHLLPTSAPAAPGPRMPQVISTSSTELAGFTTLSQNKPQGSDKNK